VAGAHEAAGGPLRLSQQKKRRLASGLAMTRRSTTWRTLLLTALLVLGVALAGCHDLGATTQQYNAPEPQGGPEAGGAGTDAATNQTDEDQQEAEPEPAPPEPQDLRLQLQSPGGLFTDEAADLHVLIDGSNVSLAELEWAGVRWSDDPTEVDEDPSSSDGFSGSQETNGAFTASEGYVVNDWNPPGAGTYYLRAHLVADGFHYWSPEVTLQVTPVVQEGDFDVDESIRLRTNLTNPCEGDTFSQNPIEITAGTVIEWVNAASCDHRIAHDAQDPLWDTGTIEPNNSSQHAYRFNKPGTYEVTCLNHPQMLTSIIVE
jgi:plastocyanin